MLDVVRAVNGGWGQGLNYWEPTWINNTSLGSPCQVRVLDVQLMTSLLILLQDNVLFEGDWSKWPDEIVGYSRPSVDILLQ